jgi:hypothetical protein
MHRRSRLSCSSERGRTADRSEMVARVKRHAAARASSGPPSTLFRRLDDACVALSHEPRCDPSDPQVRSRDDRTKQESRDQITLLGTHAHATRLTKKRGERMNVSVLERAVFVASALVVTSLAAGCSSGPPDSERTEEASEAASTCGGQGARCRADRDCCEGDGYLCKNRRCDWDGVFWCSLHPTSPTCHMNPCEDDPNAAGCTTCDDDPHHPGCNSCEDDPTGSSCPLFPPR